MDRFTSINKWLLLLALVVALIWFFVPLFGGTLPPRFNFQALVWMLFLGGLLA